MSLSWTWLESFYVRWNRSCGDSLLSVPGYRNSAQPLPHNWASICAATFFRRCALFQHHSALHSSTLHEHAQLSFGKAELRDATIQADQEFGKHPDDGFIQAFESGEMDGNFSVEFA